MKKMKILTIILLMLCLTSFIAADDCSVNVLNKFTYSDSNGNEHTFYDVYGNKVALKYVFDNDNNYTIASTRGVVYPYKDEVRLNSTSKINGTRVKVSADVKGKATVSVSSNVTTTTSYSANISASIQGRIFNLINASMSGSFTITNGKSYSNTQINAFDVPEGKIGAVYFTPYILKSEVYFYDNNGSRLSITVKNPIVKKDKDTKTEFTDGLYELVTRNA